MDLSAGNLAQVTPELMVALASLVVLAVTVVLLITSSAAEVEEV
jgi:hypothetical protein